ncbi:formate dehydrogenase gamma subunit [Candidatus Koribacter versatilis Ellin345]|uniref:Formate dehydrogenase gamma subunit n=1 Tax=Koribacter versatilis (strain Ellin345) TaxID=204669 RepID=Q1ITC7_KORVE|nr:formate dehydrogenase subunit gamma [Candidatus Koribacter versatilis]ABF39873.1 formate dehydrogenase gamma subunit [Candidatus Koribacter versatilis Ellin345]
MSEISHAVLRHEPPAGRIQRFTWTERLMHWYTAVTYIYCGISGLAFFSPHLYWMALLLGGAPSARVWHPIVGLGFVAGIFWMHHCWARDLTLDEDDRLWLKNVKYYIKNEDEKLPPQGKYDAGQKIYYWVMLGASILLILTGFFMWYPEILSRSMHWALPILVFFHAVAALLTIGGVMIHIYMSVSNVPGSLKAMTEGHVSRGWAMLHAPKWYARITAREPR